MKEEISVAVNWWIDQLKKHKSMEHNASLAEQFRTALSSELVQRFTNHWSVSPLSSL
jgi:hypothetical protein